MYEYAYIYIYEYAHKNLKDQSLKYHVFYVKEILHLARELASILAEATSIIRIFRI